MWIVKVALNRPYTFIVLALLIFIISPVMISRTPTDIFPSIDIPVIAVAWQYSGLNSEELEGRLDATLRRVRASPLMMRVITTAPHDERVATAPSHPLRLKKSLTRAYTSCSRGSSVTRRKLRC